MSVSREPRELFLRRRALDGVGYSPDPIGFARQHVGPMALHVVVHADRGRLVDGDEHRLAAIAAPGEMAHQIGRDPVKPVWVGDEMVWLGEAARDRVLFVFAEIGLVDHAGDVVAKLFVGQMQLGQPAFVIERHGRAVGDRLGEVVDRHVVAEHFARSLLFAGDQRRAGEADEGRVRQRRAHVGGEDVVLAAVRFVGDDDDVAARRELRENLAPRRAEFLDQGEDVALVPAQTAPSDARGSAPAPTRAASSVRRRRRRFRRSGRRVPRGR